MPPDQREVWRMVFDHYIFGVNGDPVEHLPDHARGMLGVVNRRNADADAGDASPPAQPHLAWREAMLNRREADADCNRGPRIPFNNCPIASSSPSCVRPGPVSDRGSDPYRIAGTNMWYAAYLGADAPIGNRDRLKRELDRLTALGVNNVRILGIVRIFAAEELASRPTFRDRTNALQ